EADLTDGEGLADATAGATDHDALEELDPGASALDDPDVNLEGVTGPELRDVGPQRGGVKAVQRMHVRSLSRECHRSPAQVDESAGQNGHPSWEPFSCAV